MESYKRTNKIKPCKFQVGVARMFNFVCYIQFASRSLSFHLPKKSAKHKMLGQGWKIKLEMPSNKNNQPVVVRVPSTGATTEVDIIGLVKVEPKRFDGLGKHGRMTKEKVLAKENSLGLTFKTKDEFRI